MADRLSQLVESVHERLAAVRERVREQAPDPDTVLEETAERSASVDDGAGAETASVWPELHESEEIADVDDTAPKPQVGETSLRCSRCGSELGENPNVGEEGLLCRSCGEGLRVRLTDHEAPGEDEESGPAQDGNALSIKRSPICSRCLGPLGEDPVETESAVYCQECVNKAPHLQQAGDDRQQGHDDGDGSDRGGIQRQSPTTQWRNQGLSPRQRAIMKHLHGAHPCSLTAKEIADRLSGGARVIGGVDKSVVNSELYGDLSEWLEKEGDAPPHWRLRPAQSTTGGEWDR